MKTFLALDCGGSKVAAILYGEDFSRRAVCVTGSLRSNSTPKALRDAHLAELIGTLGLAGQTVESVGGICEGYVIDELRRACGIRESRLSSELELGLAAAGIFGDGMLALCGTGATIWARMDGRNFGAGGYGFAVADEGSGYYIGREGVIAAIRAHEGRGEETTLADRIPHALGYAGRDEMREAVFSIYGKPDTSPSASVARFAPVVIAAAADGDAVSAGILRDAGRLVAEQALYLIRAHRFPDALPLTVSGSVWRGNPIFCGEFFRIVRAECPTRPIALPALEPVLGVLARQIHEETGVFGAAETAALAARFPEFRFDMQNNPAAERAAEKERKYAAGSLQGSR